MPPRAMCCMNCRTRQECPAGQPAGAPRWAQGDTLRPLWFSYRYNPVAAMDIKINTGMLQPLVQTQVATWVPQHRTILAATVRDRVDACKAAFERHNSGGLPVSAGAGVASKRATPSYKLQPQYVK